MVLAHHVNLAAVAQDLEELGLVPRQHPLEPGSVFRIITAMPVHTITSHLTSQAIDLVLMPGCATLEGTEMRPASSGGSCEIACSLTIPSVFVRACPCPSIPRSDRTGQGTYIARPCVVGDDPAAWAHPTPPFCSIAAPSLTRTSGGGMVIWHGASPGQRTEAEPASLPPLREHPGRAISLQRITP